MAASVRSASPAAATPLGNVLILSTSVSGGTSAEAAAATADGYAVTVASPTTWDSMSSASFSSYSAIILGDPSCGTSASAATSAAVSDLSTWESVVNGNVIVAGNAPVAAATGPSPANPTGATTFTDDAISYALAGGSGKTGLYMSLSCYYASASPGTAVPLFGGLPISGVTVGGGIASGDSGTVNVPVEDGAPAFRGMTNQALLGWSPSVEETFGGTIPPSYQVLALDQSVASSDFTGLDGLDGEPYVLINDAPNPRTFTGPVNGTIPTSATYGDKNPAAPGITSGIAVAGDGINPATGDFSLQASDASVTTYGPPLSVDRTYDSALAQSEAAAGKSGIFGYGWSSSASPSLTVPGSQSFNSQPSDIYTLGGGFSAPMNEAVDGAGNIYVADFGNSEVKELAATTHTQWGISMIAGQTYVIAGTGTSGFTGDGGPSTSAELDLPTGVSLGPSGNLYIADVGESRVREVLASSGTISTVVGTGSAGCTANGVAGTSTAINPGSMAVDNAGNLYVADNGGARVLEFPASSGTKWGISMAAGDDYTVAGKTTCASGHTGDGGRATSAKLDEDLGVSVDGSGDLIISDTGNMRVQEVAAANSTQWGISMTANDIYTIAGNSAGTGGHSGDGGPSTSSYLVSPYATFVDSGGDILIADSGNNRIQEMAATTHSQWGVAMTAGDIYTVAGSASGYTGYTGDGGSAPSSLLARPTAVAIDPSGNMVITDSGNEVLRVVDPSVTVNQGDGAQATFAPAVAGVCPNLTVGSGASGTYCTAPYVTAALTFNPTANTYTLITHPHLAYVFNSSGQLTSESTPGGATLTATYASPSPGSGQCPSAASTCFTVTSASGRALVFGENSQGLVTTVTDPLGNTWTYAYSSGRLTSVTDPMNRVTSYSYDTTNSNPNFADDLLTVTAPNGQTGGTHAGAKLQNNYDPTTGVINSQTDPDGWTTSVTGSGTWDPKVTDPDGNITQYEFFGGVLGVKIVGYGSSVPSDTYYNPSATTLLQTSVIDPDGGVTTNVFDAFGNVTSTTNPLGETSTHAYNSFDETVCSTTPMATSPCSALSSPAAVSPGGAITPPSSAPPPFATYWLYDTNGDELYQTQGVYAPGSTTTTTLRTSYELYPAAGTYAASTVTIGGVTSACAEGGSPPSLPCASIDPDGPSSVQQNSHVTQTWYDAQGDVDSVQTPDGNYDSGEFNPVSYSLSYSWYDADGNRTSYVSPYDQYSENIDNYQTEYRFDADREMIESVLAPSGGDATVPTATTANYYDANGNLIATIDPDGNPYGSGDSYGDETLSGCNPATTSGCTSATYNAFDADNRKTEVLDPTGNATLTCYDGAGNEAETVPPVGMGSLTPASCPTSYPAGYAATAPYLLSAAATMDTYDAQNQPTVVTTPPATGSSTESTTTNDYDPAGHLLETIAPPGTSGGANQVSTATYDLAGQPAAQTTGFGTSTPMTTTNCYDPSGEQTATVPGSGNSSGLVPCQTAAPWQTSSVQQTATTYDSVGDLLSTFSPPPSTTSSTPVTTSYTYDPAGNKVTSTDPSGVVTSSTFSPLNTVLSFTVSSGGGASTSTSYDDGAGNLIAVTAPGGDPYSATNPTGCNPIVTSTCADTTYNTYNSANQLVTTRNADNETTTNYYNATGNKIATTGPSGNPSTCNPVTTASCSDTVYYTYNTLNQLTCQSEPNSANDTCSSLGTGAGITKFTYVNGQRATMTYWSGTAQVTETYTYDSSNRMVEEQTGSTVTSTYAYGPNSDETCVSYQNSSGNTCTSSGTGLQGVVKYTYNQANQLASISDWAGNTLAYTDDSNGSPTSLSVNSGAVRVATTYDSAGNASSIDTTASSGSTTLLDLGTPSNPITRASNGDISTVPVQVGTTTMATDTFGYNANNQVSSGPITGGSGSGNYAYTPAGGVTQDTTRFASAAYDPAGELCWTSSSSSANACTAPPTGASTYTSNSQGERTLTQPASGAPQAYAWDTALGTLSCANANGTTCSTTSPGTVTTLYGYDGDGLRVWSKYGGATTNYTWSANSPDPKLLSDSTWDYIYAPGSATPIEQIGVSGSSPTVDLLVADAAKSIRGIVQISSGTHQNQLVNYTDYDSFGNPITMAGGTYEAGGLTQSHTALNTNYVGTSAFGFGEGYSDSTGLVYLVNRYYDPSSAQFLSVDPAVSSTNQPYVYANDNPVNNTDANGMCSTPLWFTFGWTVYANFCGPYWPIFVFVSLVAPSVIVAILSYYTGGIIGAAVGYIVGNFVGSLQDAWKYSGSASRQGTSWHDCYQIPLLQGQSRVYHYRC